MEELFLDNASTTPLLKEVKQKIIDSLDIFGNPSTSYNVGRKAKQMIEEARNEVAKFINADSKDIIFTSGGSANNNLATQIIGYQCLYSPIAHTSLIKKVSGRGIKLSVNNKGLIDLNDLENQLSYTSLHCIVLVDYANSEIGTIQNVKEIIRITHKYNGYVYLDCTGSIPTIPLNVKELDVDMIGFSAHKIGGLKGTGVFYHKPIIKLSPLIYGNQEQGLFGGTENTLGIIALGEAVKNYKYPSLDLRQTIDNLHKKIKEIYNDCYLVGTPIKDRLINNLYICFKGIDGESLKELLSVYNIDVSNGSACNSHEIEPSHTLKAIYINKEDIGCCIRITLNGKETATQLKYFTDTLDKIIKQIKK